MTLTQLNRHFRRIEQRTRTRELLQSLREVACPGAQNLTGMPHASGVQDRVGDLAAEIADTETELQALDAEIHKAEAEILTFVQSIPDTQVRMIFRLRFLRGLSWKEVATVVGGRNTPDSVKIICYRYLCG